MIEIIFLVVALAAFRETARRRGVAGWPFILAALIGWFLVGNVAAAIFGVGPHFFFSWGWVGLTYISIYIIGGGGRRLKDTGRAVVKLVRLRLWAAASVMAAAWAAVAVWAEAAAWATRRTSRCSCGRSYMVR